MTRKCGWQPKVEQNKFLVKNRHTQICHVFLFLLTEISWRFLLGLWWGCAGSGRDRAGPVLCQPTTRGFVWQCPFVDTVRFSCLLGCCWQTGWRKTCPVQYYRAGTHGRCQMIAYLLGWHACSETLMRLRGLVIETATLWFETNFTTNELPQAFNHITQLDSCYSNLKGKSPDWLKYGIIWLERKHHIFFWNWEFLCLPNSSSLAPWMVRKLTISRRKLHNFFRKQTFTVGYKKRCWVGECLVRVRRQAWEVWRTLLTPRITAEVSTPCHMRGGKLCLLSYRPLLELRARFMHIIEEHAFGLDEMPLFRSPG